LSVVKGLINLYSSHRTVSSSVLFFPSPSVVLHPWWAKERVHDIANFITIIKENSWNLFCYLFTPEYTSQRESEKYVTYYKIVEKNEKNKSTITAE